MWHDPDDRLQKAVDRFEEGDVETARSMLRALDRLGVLSPRIDLYLAHCHLEDDRPRAALRRYRRALGLDPREASAWVGVALCHGRLGRLESAVEALERARRLDPDREDVHCHLAHCHALLGDLAAAKAHAEHAIRRDPTCPHVHRHLAVAHLLNGDPAQGLACWKEVLARDPAHPEADVGVGRCLAALGRRAEARRRFLAALDGDYAADAHAGLGQIAWGEGRIEDAVVHFRGAVHADPDHADARLRLAETLAELGQVAEAWTAIEPLSTSWDTGPEAEDVADLEVAEAAARIRRLGGRPAEGLRLLRALWARSPGAVDRAVAVGRYLLEARRPAAARRVLAPAAERERRARGALGASATRLLARALGRVGRAREAIPLLSKAADLAPGAEELQLDLAAAHLAVGRPARAERALLRALGRAPGLAGLWAAAAELAIEDDRPEAARARIRRALALDRRHGLGLALLTRYLVERGSWLRAVHAARAASRVLPRDHAVVKHLAEGLLGLGWAGEAILPLRRYVLAQPGDPEGYRLLGRALEATGDAPGASLQRRLSRAAVLA